MIGLYILTLDGQPQTRICRKLDFQHFHNSKGVFGTTLVGTRFNIYYVVLSALVHKHLGRLELLSILRIMFTKVKFLLVLHYFGPEYHA